MKILQLIFNQYTPLVSLDQEKNRIYPQMVCHSKSYSLLLVRIIQRCKQILAFENTQVILCELMGSLFSFDQANIVLEVSCGYTRCTKSSALFVLLYHMHNSCLLSTFILTWGLNYSSCSITPPWQRRGSGKGEKTHRLKLKWI